MKKTTPLTAPDRVLALGWHDGATTGLAEYGDYPHLFQFDLVTSVAAEPRVFFLRSSPVSKMNDLDDALAPLGVPQFPVWAPVWRFSSESAKVCAEAAVAAAAPTTAPVIAVVVAEAIHRTPVIVRAIVTERDLGIIETLRRRNANVGEWMDFCKTTSEAISDPSRGGE